MEERTWERLGALSGVGFVVLLLLSTFLYPQQPRVDAAPAVTLAWVHGHRTAIQTGMVLGLFGAALLLWFVGHLRHVMDRVEGPGGRLAPIVFGSGIAVAVVSALAALPTTLLAFMDAQPQRALDPAVVQMLGDLNIVLFAASAVLTLVFLAAIGAAMLNGELGTRWLGRLSLVAAVFNGVAVWESATFSTYHGGGWAAPDWIAFLGFVVVVLLVSVSMLRKPETAPSPSGPAVLAAA